MRILILAVSASAMGLALPTATTPTLGKSARQSPFQFTLSVSSKDAAISGNLLYATDNSEIEIDGVLQPVPIDSTPAGSAFYLDSSTGRLMTTSPYTGQARIGYSVNSDGSGTIKFNVNPDTTPVYYPQFILGPGGALTSGNMTWSWCPDNFGVGDSSSQPGSFTLGETATGCEAVTGIFAVATSS